MPHLPIYAHWDSTGTFKVAVAGTSYYRSETAAIAQNQPGAHALVICLAYLVPDNKNPHDSSAVKVLIDGKTVGHLPACYARIYRSYISEVPPHIKHVSVAAAITNGLTTREKTYSYTIELDIPEDLKMHAIDTPMDDEVIRVNGYAPLQQTPDGSYVAKVWVPIHDFNELDLKREVQEWTTDNWETVNFYALNKQRIGLGLKVYELSKQNYATLFQQGPISGNLILGKGRFATLRIEGVK